MKLFIWVINVVLLLNQSLKQFDIPYNIYHYPNSVEVVNFLNRGILIEAKGNGRR